MFAHAYWEDASRTSPDGPYDIPAMLELSREYWTEKNDLDFKSCPSYVEQSLEQCLSWTNLAGQNLKDQGYSIDSNLFNNSDAMKIITDGPEPQKRDYQYPHDNFEGIRPFVGLAFEEWINADKPTLMKLKNLIGNSNKPSSLDREHFALEVGLLNDTQEIDAEAQEQKREEKEKYDRIYNACLLDKSLEFDMQIEGLRNAVYETCKSIADDPTWLENFKYN